MQTKRKVAENAEGRRVKPELRSGYLLPVVGQASCLSIAAKKLWEIFAGLFAGHGRLEACSTNQRRSDFGVRA